MMNELEDLIRSGAARSVFVGFSVTEKPRFCTLKDAAGNTVAIGHGHTCEEAIRDAVAKLSRPRQIETAVQVPGFGEVRIPSNFKLPGI